MTYYTVYTYKGYILYIYIYYTLIRYSICIMYRYRIPLKRYPVSIHIGERHHMMTYTCRPT